MVGDNQLFESKGKKGQVPRLFIVPLLGIPTSRNSAFWSLLYAVSLSFTYRLPVAMCPFSLQVSYFCVCTWILKFIPHSLNIDEYVLNVYFLMDIMQDSGI